MKIQILFGSQNDERVFNPLVESLNSLAEVTMTVASAHRHPSKVRDIVVSDQADLFIAGAGLAAHLPGVVASLTSKCVFGIAVNGAFAGLDAFLSIAQMPKDIPVMGLTENNILDLAPFLKKIMAMNFEVLHLNWNRENSDPMFKEALAQIETTIKIPIAWTEVQAQNCLGQICMLNDTKSLAQSHGLNLLLLSAEDKKNPQKAFDFFQLAGRGGFWVGVNNLQNFSLQILKLKELNSKIKS